MKPEASRMRMAESVLFIVMLMCVILVGAKYLLTASERPSATNMERPQPVAVGTTVALPEGIKPGPRGTVLLALSTQCRFCEESIPFYERLTTSLLPPTAAVRVAVLAVDQVEKMQAYLSSKGINISDVVPAFGSGIRVTATPTLLILDAGGVVKGSWEGRLDGDQQAEVQRAIAALLGN